MLNKYPLILLLITNNILASCTYVRTDCTETGSTKIIDGVSVTLDCWRKKDIYICTEPSSNNCQPLRNQGCAQVRVNCRKRDDNICAVTDQVFSCPVERCDEVGSITCGKKPFCVGTSCTTTNPTKNKNFDKTISYLAALADAAKQVADKQIGDIHLKSIFKGKPMECSDAWSGAKDCCSSNPSGWAHGKFMHCDAEEKQLAQQRNIGNTIYAGSYCNNRIPLTNVCASRHKVHCVFDSKIARIVQEEGRYKQLGRPFWLPGDDDHDHSDCSGISIEDLQKLDFSRMDFSAIYDEITKNTKKQKDTKENLVPKAESEIADRLRGFYDRVKK